MDQVSSVPRAFVTTRSPLIVLGVFRHFVLHNYPVFARRDTAEIDEYDLGQSLGKVMN